MIFSTIYFTLSHDLLKEELIELLGGLFKGKARRFLPVMKQILKRSLLLNTKTDINYGRIKICMKL